MEYQSFVLFPSDSIKSSDSRLSIFDWIIFAFYPNDREDESKRANIIFPILISIEPAGF